MTRVDGILENDSINLLQAVFGDRWGEAWVCWTSNMKGRRVRHLRQGDLPGDEDCYFCIALFPEGVGDRKLAMASSVHALVIDDVGTKIPIEATMLMAAPTWVIETSAGNFHYGYAIEGGATVEEYRELREAMKGGPFGKSDGIDAVHLFRLPQGTNTKHGRKISC